MNKLGENIERLRTKKGLTQAQLADKLHYTYQTVSNWERGISRPDYETLTVLAKFFGVTTDVLLGLSEPREATVVEVIKNRHVTYEETVTSAKALNIVIIIYYVFFVFLMVIKSTALSILLYIPQLLAMFLFVICKKPAFENNKLIFAAYGILVGYVILHFLQNFIDLSWLNWFALVYDTVSILVLLLFFKNKQPHYNSRKPNVFFWIALAVLIVFYVYSIWLFSYGLSAHLAQYPDDLQGIFGFMMVGAWIFMIFITFLTFAKENKTHIIRY